jgi:hypothetical protein
MAKPKTHVLSSADQAWLDGMGGKQWCRKTPGRLLQRKRYFKLLDGIAAKLGDTGIDDPLDPETLRSILGVVLSKDGTFGAEFRDRHPDVLKTDEGWTRLWSVCAGKLVEEYLGQREGRPAVRPVLLLDSEVQSTVSQLLDFAVAQGLLSEEEGRAAKEDFIQPGNAPDMIEFARSRLEELLASDVNVAHVAAGDDIPEHEREMEIAKGALLQLKISQLRQIAKREDLPLLADREALSTLIARKYKASREEIADLVLKYSVDNPEIGYMTHLIPLSQPPQPETVAAAAARLRGRFLRLSVAHWLVVTEMSLDAAHAGQPAGVSFSGAIRYYDISPQREGAQFEIAAKKRSAPITVRCRKDVRWAEVDGRNVTEIRRIRAALGRQLGINTSDALPINVPPLDGTEAQWAPISLLMLHILEIGLRDEHVDYATFTTAQFSSPPQPGAEADPMRVAIRQVRLAGTHVLSSPDACRLIADARQMLTVDFRARYTPVVGGDSFFATVRIILDEDHATVMTSFGDQRAMSKQLHQLLVERLRRALERGVEQAGQLAAIIKQVKDRSVETGQVASADILPPTSDAHVARTAAPHVQGETDGQTVPEQQ